MRLHLSGSTIKTLVYTVIFLGFTSSLVACDPSLDENYHDSRLRIQSDTPSVKRIEPTSITVNSDPITSSDNQPSKIESGLPKADKVHKVTFLDWAIGMGRDPTGVVAEVKNELEIVVDFDGFEHLVVIKYLGIDSSGMNFEQKKSAHSLNRFLIEGKSISVSTEDIIYDKLTGIYSAYVYSGGEFINALMVNSGYLVVSTDAAHIRKKEILISAQEDAMTRGQGLWEGIMNGTKNTCGTLPCPK